MTESADPPDDGASSERWSRSWSIAGSRGAIAGVIDEVIDCLSTSGHGDAAVFAVRLALEETLANAVRHGHGGDEAREIQVRAEIGSVGVTLEVEDGGVGFDPEAVPDPTAEENLTIASGRGLALIRAFMSEVIVHAPGNRIAMRFDRTS